MCVGRVGIPELSIEQMRPLNKQHLLPESKQQHYTYSNPDKVPIVVGCVRHHIVVAVGTADPGWRLREFCHLLWHNKTACMFTSRQTDTVLEWFLGVNRASGSSSEVAPFGCHAHFY